jgi:predicted AlkP superfamily pyrophosphatase or phosphodiesterase
MRALLAMLCLFLLALGSFAQPPAPIADLQPTVILISFDGFRYDYADKVPTPNIHRLIRRGVRAEYMRPAFPTKTFPNHYTLVTGLYPAHHGIVANNMYDPEMNASFTMHGEESAAVLDPRWWGGEPVWVTAERQGLIAASMFWPGSEARPPTYTRKYDHDLPFEKRIEQVLAWLDLPRARRPRLITAYFAGSDDAGHHHGPDSPGVEAEIRHLDAVLGMLLDGLQQRGIGDRVNIILTADHGMQATSPATQIFLEDILDMDDVHVVDWSPVLMIRSRSGKDESLYQALSRARIPASVYRKPELPARYHFRDSPRIPPVIAVADAGWGFTTRERLRNRKSPELGAHGYDNALRSMQATFIASGPAVQRGITVPAFDNIHVYSLVCRILGVRPAPNDGSLQPVRVMLR